MEFGGHPATVGEAQHQAGVVLAPGGWIRAPPTVVHQGTKGIGRYAGRALQAVGSPGLAQLEDVSQDVVFGQGHGGRGPPDRTGLQPPLHRWGAGLRPCLRLAAGTRHAHALAQNLQHLHAYPTRLHQPQRPAAWRDDGGGRHDGPRREWRGRETIGVDRTWRRHARIGSRGCHRGGPASAEQDQDGQQPVHERGCSIRPCLQEVRCCRPAPGSGLWPQPGSSTLHGCRPALRCCGSGAWSPCQRPTCTRRTATRPGPRPSAAPTWSGLCPRRTWMLSGLRGVATAQRRSSTGLPIDASTGGRSSVSPMPRPCSARWIGQHAGIRVHGPVLQSLADYTDAASRLALRDLLIEGRRPMLAGRWLCGAEAGPVEGRLVGGNLCVLASLAGTPWALDSNRRHRRPRRRVGATLQARSAGDTTAAVRRPVGRAWRRPGQFRQLSRARGRGLDHRGRAGRPALTAGRARPRRPASGPWSPEPALAARGHGPPGRPGAACHRLSPGRRSGRCWITPWRRARPRASPCVCTMRMRPCCPCSRDRPSRSLGRGRSRRTPPGIWPA